MFVINASMERKIVTCRSMKTLKSSMLGTQKIWMYIILINTPHNSKFKRLQQLCFIVFVGFSADFLKGRGYQFDLYSFSETIFTNKLFLCESI